MLRRDDAWVWDSWLVDDDELFHLFFLSAPRSLGDPELRHFHAEIGHATSPDLIDWTDHGTALAPSADGWDDLSMWTGSVIRRPGGGWAMFYTALGSRGLRADDQRIGLALSDDLFTWERVGDAPIVTADARWYRTQPGDLHASATWRDPFVLPEPDGDGWRMLVTARAVDGAPGDDGVLGQARSHDLLHWEVGPPLSSPGTGFSQLEVTHVHEVDGRPVLTFSCHPIDQTAGRIAADGRHGTWVVAGPAGGALTGPWDVSAARPFVGHPSLYAAPLVQQRDGTWVLLGFRTLDPEERVGDDDGLAVGDPIPVTLVDGALVAVDSLSPEGDNDVLRLNDAWVWDSWIADDGELYHLFFLTAPRSLGGPEHRHTAARIGHATSADLVEWQVHPEALGPDPDGWDDLALWTGSVVRGDDGVWRMFYTAINTGGHGVKDQKVGVVESDDLFTWRRVTDKPVLVAAAPWYKTLDEDPSASETWRDPFVFRDPDGDGWRMLVAARAVGAAKNDDGVLAEGRSDDLLHWELGPPVCAPGEGFGQLEVAQVRVIDGTPTLVFTCHPQEMTASRIAESGEYCTWSLTGPSVTGPWDISRAQPFVEEPDLFAAPLVQQRDGSWALVGFRNLEPKGIDAFEIMDPITVALSNGRLVRAESAS